MNKIEEKKLTVKETTCNGLGWITELSDGTKAFSTDKDLSIERAFCIANNVTSSGFMEISYLDVNAYSTIYIPRQYLLNELDMSINDIRKLKCKRYPSQYKSAIDYKAVDVYNKLVDIYCTPVFKNKVRLSAKDLAQKVYKYIIIQANIVELD